MMEDSMKDMMDEYLPLRDVVFRTLRRAILKGELKPGERLMEVQLANRLGVSPDARCGRPSESWSWRALSP